MTHWISVNDQLPDVDKNDCTSANVWATNGKQIFILNRFYDGHETMWANCYGDVFSEGTFDDDYEITHWQPLIIPDLPQDQSHAST